MLTLVGNKLSVFSGGRHDCDDSYLYSSPDSSCKVQAYAFDGTNFNAVGSSATLVGTSAGGSFFVPTIYRRNGFVFGHAGSAFGCQVKIRLYKYLFDGSSFVQQAIFTDTYASGMNSASACFDTNGTYVAFIVNNSSGGNHIYMLDFDLNLLYTTVMTASRVTIDSRNVVYVGSNAYQFNGSTLSLIGSTPEAIIDTDGDILFSENKAYSYGGGSFPEEASVPAGTIKYYDRLKNKVISLDGSNNTYIYNYTSGSFSLVDEGSLVGIGFGSLSYYFLKYGTDIGAYTSGGVSPPVADFVGSPTGGYAPLGVTFTDLSTNTPTSWAWNFGDGSPTGTDQNLYHTYTGVGTYSVSLTVANDGGSDTTTKLNYISVFATPIMPVADFIGNPRIGHTPQTVEFTDLSTGMPTIWLWSFGDGETGSLQNPSHTYTSQGIYTVSLKVTNEYGDDDETKTDYIEIKEHELSVNANATVGIIPMTVNFTVDVLSGEWDSFIWDFGDGQSGTGDHVSHTYTTTGYHTVVLVGRKKNTQTETVIKRGWVRVGKLSFEASPSLSKKTPLTVSFTNTSYAPTGYEFKDWSWDFGDATLGSGETGPVHVYTEYGTYNVTMRSKMEKI